MERTNAKADLETTTIAQELDWGPESTHDQFCFLCDSDPEILQKDHGQWLHLLKKMIDDGEDYMCMHSRSLYTKCTKISQYFIQNILPHQKDQRKWTLRSIQKHLVCHCVGLGPRGRLNVLKNIQIQLIDEVHQTLKGSNGYLSSGQKSKWISCLTSMMHMDTYMIMVDHDQCKI